MSTNINITVGGNSLVDQAKAQQAASRQAQLNKEQQARTEAEAESKRTSALTAQGLSPTGTPLTGTPPRTQFRLDEPAANRQKATDIFGYFYIEQDAYVDGKFGFYVSCGNDSANQFIPYPEVADFPDLLLPYLAGGELTGERKPAFQTPPFYTLRYDSLGRLLGSFSPSGDATVWKPSYDAFWSYTTGLVTAVYIKAIYRQYQNSYYQVLPVGSGAAIVCIGMLTVKTATVSAIRGDRDKYYGQSPECIYEISPENYKEFSFDRRHTEQFHAIYVSNNQIRYIGEAPSGWVNKIKNLPLYQEVNDESMTSLQKQLSTYSYYNSPAYPGSCAQGDQPVQVTYVYDKLFNNFDMSPLFSNYQKGYKFLADLVTNTPAAFEILNNYQSFVADSPSPITDAFVKSYVPSFAGDSLKWRYAEANPDFNAFTPYLYQGQPPTSWYTSPVEILDNFPSEWKKSGKIVENMNPNNWQAVWDWNNPAYCRQQLLALGFSSADLTP